MTYRNACEVAAVERALEEARRCSYPDGSRFHWKRYLSRLDTELHRELWLIHGVKL